MYAENPKQAVKMRGFATRMREDARETTDKFYRRLFENAALDLEGEAEQMDRNCWSAQYDPH
jgi:hypothetical protein